MASTTVENFVVGIQALYEGHDQLDALKRDLKTVGQVKSFEKLQGDFQETSVAMAVAKKSMRALHKQMQSSHDEALGTRMEKAAEKTRKLTTSLDNQKAKLGILGNELSQARATYEKYEQAMQEGGGSEKEIARLDRLRATLDKTELRYRKQKLAVKKTSTALEEASGRAEELARSYEKSIDPKIAKQYEAAKKKVKELSQSQAHLKSKLDASRKSLQEQGVAVNDLGKEKKRLNGVTEKEAKRIAAMRKVGIRAYDDIEEEVRSLERAYKDLEEAGTLSAKDLTRAYDKVQKKIAALRAEADGLDKDLKKNSKGGGDGFAEMAISALSGLGLSAALEEFVMFDDAMLRVQALSQATGEIFEGLKNQAADLGRTTRFSSTEAALGMTELAAAGMKAQEITASLPSALALTAVSGGDLKEVADQLTNIMSQFQMEADQSGHVADVLTRGFTGAATSMDQLANAMVYVGPVAASIGYSLEDTTAILQGLANAGYKGEKAGTALRGGLTRLIKPMRAGKRVLQKYNLQIFDSAGKVRNFADILEDLGKAALSPREAFQLFGQEAGPGMLALLSQGAEGIRKFRKELDDLDGITQDMADHMESGLGGSLRALSAAISAISISFGDEFAPALMETADGLQLIASALAGMPDPLQHLVGGFGLLLGATTAYQIGVRLLGGSVKEAVVSLGKFATSTSILAQAIGYLFSGLIGWDIGWHIGEWALKFELAEKAGIALAAGLHKAGLQAQWLWASLFGNDEDLKAIEEEIDHVEKFYSEKFIDASKKVQEAQLIASEEALKKITEAAKKGAKEQAAVIKEVYKDNLPNIVRQFHLEVDNASDFSKVRTAILEALVDSGHKEKVAAEIFNNSLAAITHPTEKAKEILEKYNLQVSDASGNVRNFTDILEDLGNAALSESEIVELFGQKAGPDMAKFLHQGGDSIRKYVKEQVASAHAADVLIRGSKISAESLDQLINALSVASSKSANIGYSFEQTLGILKALAAAGYEGAEGGEMLAKGLENLIIPTKAGRAVLDKYNLQILDSSGGMRDFADIMEDMGKVAFSEGEAVALFGQKIGPDMVKFSKQGADSIRKYVREAELFKRTSEEQAEAIKKVSAEQLFGIARQFKLEADQAGHAADVLMRGFRGMEVPIEQLVTAMHDLGPAAANASYSMEDTMAILQTLVEAGYDVKEAVKILGKSFTTLAQPTEEAKKVLEKYNLQIFDSSGKVRNFADIVEDLGSKALSESETLALFGQKAGPGMVKFLNQGAEGIRKYRKELENIDWAAEVPMEVKVRREKSTQESFAEIDREGTRKRENRETTLADNDAERSRELAKEQEAYKNAETARQIALEAIRAQAGDTHKERLAFIEAERQAEKDAHKERLALINIERKAQEQKWKEEAASREAEIQYLKSSHQAKMQLLRDDLEELEEADKTEEAEALARKIVERENQFAEEIRKVELQEHEAQRKHEQGLEKLTLKEDDENRAYKRTSSRLGNKTFKENKDYKKKLKEEREAQARRQKEEKVSQKAEKLRRKQEAAAQSEEEDERRRKEEQERKKREEEAKKKNRVEARAHQGESRETGKDEREEKKAEERAEREEDRQKRLAALKAALTGDDKDQVTQLEDARTKASDTWLEKEKENTAKAQTAFEDYTRRVKKLSDEAAQRNRQNQEDLIALDPLASEETKWKRRAQLAREYEQQAREAMEAGEYEKARELSDQAKTSYTGLKDDAGTISEKLVKNTIYSGVKSNAELAAAIDRLAAQSLTQQKPAVALNAVSANLNEKTLAALGQSVQKSQMENMLKSIQSIIPTWPAQEKKSAQPVQPQEASHWASKKVEIKLGRATVFASEGNSKMLLDELQEAALTA